VRPYYDHGGITIYNGRSEEILPMLGNFCLTLTDPPYGINGGTGGTSKLRGRGNYEGIFNSSCDTSEYIKNTIVPIINLCIEKSIATIVTPGNKNFCLYPQPDSFGVLYQPSSGGVSRWGWCDSQPIFYYGISKNQGKHMEPCSFLKNSNDDCDYPHPCPKPYKIWKKLFLKGVHEEGIILDPFLGSGTTLRIAKDLNRKAIGIEINEKYCEIAAQRLSQEVLPL
jgi:site-specific DNA-methyltransferase (adenine-specific)